MADQILTIKSNMRKLLKIGAADLKDNSYFFKNTEKLEESAFKPDPTGHSPGDVVSIHIPTEWSVQEDNFDITAGIQDAKERAVNATLDMSGTIAWDLDTKQLATDIDVKKEYERLLRPAILNLATNFEERSIRKATQSIGNWVGTPGSTIVDPDTVMAGGEVMDEYLAPLQNRNFLMDSGSMRSAVNANKNLFTFKRKEFDEAFIGNALGFDWYKNQLTYRHTNGNDVTGVQTDSAGIAEGDTQIPVEGLSGALLGGAVGGLGGYASGGGFNGTALGDVFGTTNQNAGYSPGEISSGPIGSTGNSGGLSGSGYGALTKYALPLSNVIGGLQQFGSQDDIQAELLKGYRNAEDTLKPYTTATWSPGDLTKDPGYQFQLDQGLQALDRSNASRGNYYSGAALKDAAGYAQGLADQTAQDAYSRWRNTQGLNYDAAKEVADTYTNMGAINGMAEAGRSSGLAQAMQGGVGLLLGYDENGKPVYQK